MPSVSCVGARGGCLTSVKAGESQTGFAQALCHNVVLRRNHSSPKLFSVSSASRGRDRQRLAVVSWKFLQDLGLKKPAFLPDFGKEKREAVLTRFYGPIDQQTYNDLLDDSFKYYEETDTPRVYTKTDWIVLMCDAVKPAVPDFNWTAAVDGRKDDDGYCLVSVQATGRHTGEPFQLPGLPPVPPNNVRFKLAEELCKVKVENGKIAEIRLIPVKGAGPLAMYKALGGKVPSATTSA